MKTITINDAQHFTISYGLSFGDILVRTKGGFLSEHYAVFIGYQNGRFAVIENQTGFGIRIISLQQFLNEGNFKRIRKLNGNPEIVLRNINIVWQRNESYNLLLNNCEHFANEVTTGTAYSSQIRKGVGLAVAGVFGLVFAPKLLGAIV